MGPAVPDSAQTKPKGISPGQTDNGVATEAAPGLYFQIPAKYVLLERARMARKSVYTLLPSLLRCAKHALARIEADTVLAKGRMAK